MSRSHAGVGNQPEVIVVPDPAALARRAVELFAGVVESVVSRRGACALALSGGSTPKAIFRLLAEPPELERIPWRRLSVFWGDERSVPPDDPESNYGMARATLLSKVPIPADQIHRMEGERPPEEAAAAYEATLRRVFRLRDDQLPVFDLQLLGLGADGHTASLFPGTPALQVRDRLCVANPVPQQRTTRLTLTRPVINASATILMLTAGREKADAVYRALEGTPDYERTPAQLLREARGRVVWLIDEAAAAELRR